MDKFLAMDSLTGAKYFLMNGRIPDEAEEQFNTGMPGGDDGVFSLGNDTTHLSVIDCSDNAINITQSIKLV
jgi:gamma-glutamyltranspeptidase